MIVAWHSLHWLKSLFSECQINDLGEQAVVFINPLQRLPFTKSNRPWSRIRVLGFLSGTYCHKTGTRPPSCGTPQQPTIYEGAVLIHIQICDEKSLSLAGIWTRDCHGLQYTKQMTYKCATVLLLSVLLTFILFLLTFIKLTNALKIIVSVMSQLAKFVKLERKDIHYLNSVLPNL